MKQLMLPRGKSISFQVFRMYSLPTPSKRFVSLEAQNESLQNLNC